MTKTAKTHREFRSLVCLLCFQKGSSMRKITDSILIKVQKFFFENFDINDPKLPCGCCSHCYNILLAIEKGSKKPSDLPNPVDFNALQFPVLTRSLGGITNLEDLEGCTCSICSIARSNAGQIGNKFGGYTKTGAFPKGRPALPGPPRLPSPGIVRKCKVCEQVIGRGIPHPQPCGLNGRRKNVQSLLEQDPKGAEMAASSLIRQKRAFAKDSASINLATPGVPMTLPNASKPSCSKALFKDSPVPAEKFQDMLTLGKFSINQIQLIAKHERTWHGRKSVEPGLEAKLRAKDKSLQDFFSLIGSKMDTKAGKKPRDIVFCNNLPGLIDHLCKVRGFHPQTRYFVKVGIDGGKELLKVCLNIEKIEDEISSPAKVKPKWSYASGACSNKLKDSGVRRLIIVGIAEDVTESYSNLKLFNDLLDLNSLRKAENANFRYAFDMKVSNCFFGMGPCSSKYGCPWCQMMRALWANDPLLAGGILRTLGLIRKYAPLYQAAAANHKGTRKLTPIDYYSCENLPLCDAPDSTYILELLPCMELHLMIGVVNKLYDNLNDILEKKSSINATNWSLPLGLKRPRQHDGEFNGNQCQTLLNNIDKLIELLKEARALTVCEPLLETMAAFKEVKKACFGMELHANYKVCIKRFADAYLQLMEHSKSMDIKLTVTNKIHAVFVHVAQFLDLQGAKGLPYGLGYFSEQSSESVHKDFEMLWTNGSYKRELTHADYASQLKKCVVTYNSRHEGKTNN